MIKELQEELEERKEYEKKMPGGAFSEKVVAIRLPSEYLKRPKNKKYKLNDAVVTKLEYALKKGHTIESACDFAGVSYQNYKEWARKYPMFETHMKLARDYLKDQALKTISYYLEQKDPDIAKWYLERRYGREFGKNPEVMAQFNNYQVEFIQADDPSN